VQSPEYVSISLASAISLRFAPGRFYRDAAPTCANLLLAYDQPCLANCSYCGLAREREVQPDDRSFIRVPWPVVPSGDVIERLARHGTGRICVSMVTHARAYRDTLALVRSLRETDTAPVSVLVAPNLLDRSRLEELRDAGAGMIGVGLDAASARVFERRRGRSVRGPLSWANYWHVMETAVAVFGRGNVNCHLVLGLGETDREMVETVVRLREAGIAAYLFCFYPEAGSRMARARRPSLVRWRRLQLVKHLLEARQLALEDIAFDPAGRVASLPASAALEAAIASGLPFMTDGCPGEDGAMACNRPFGSYRPGEAFRDYPFQPEAADLEQVRRQLRLTGLLRP
jgi:biotin synthase